MTYRAKVSLNKNKTVTFETDTKEKLLGHMKRTLSSERFSDETINEITIYEVKEVESLTYEQLLNI